MDLLAPRHGVAVTSSYPVLQATHILPEALPPEMDLEEIHPLRMNN